ncbi:ribosomal RNA small subunit methyltransferase A [Patescibacteria group bacterium]|nr:ribosomal RNA small subunit methyltransferase A [Patescibacteria group bacterium]MBU1911222.1 ribosomal RNA small subunit methyltransferase A [Patescibacteria group bacterium]
MDSLSDRVRQFCSQNHLKLNKDLGQHLLIDEGILDRIVTAALIKPDDHIIEIGPGIGILTAELLKKAGKVTAIEIDERMIILINEYINQNNESTNQRINELTIINQNALTTEFPSKSYKIVANIPYHITSPLLRHAFLESEQKPTSMTLLIQREVAEKICDEEDSGMLTILVNLFGKPQVVANVPPKSFLPPPKVDSAVLHIDCFSQPKADTETIEEIFRLTKAAFGQKRKMLRNTIGAFPRGGELLSSLGIDEKRRPQELSLEEWIALAKKSKEHVQDDKS